MFSVILFLESFIPVNQLTTLFFLMPDKINLLFAPVIYFPGTTLMMIMILILVTSVFAHQHRRIQLSTIEENKKQMQLLYAALESHEAERKLIFNELHDGVGALLSAIKLYLHQIKPDNLNNKTKVNVLNQSKDLLDETLQTIRNISSNLQPVIITDFGLESAIEHLCNKINQPPGISVSLTVEGTIEKLAKEKELAVFRIIQELTNNIIQHAHSSCINFCLLQKVNSLEIYIDYDGRGITNKEYEERLYQPQGLGLKNIQNRLNILKGHVHYEKNDNLTNTITMRIPIDQKQHHGKDN
jgi:two-component system NarL family sensor kinase